MTCKEFELLIGYHCSPVLMGLKPSNLVSVSKDKAPEMEELAALYTKKLCKRGVRLEIICGCNKNYLLLVYRPFMLAAWLEQEKVRSLLDRYGYPKEGTLEEFLLYMKKRFEEREEFPHEIGLFLGYPVEDVTGFVHHKGSNCKLCGYWKVYGDVENARRLFRQFDQCREFLTAQIQKGYSIMQVIDMKHGG